MSKSVREKKVIALICCRGGSTGIPGKNIKIFCEKPLLGWTLEHATKSSVFDEIILSTNSQEIATVGEEYGVTIPGLRPDYLATSESDVFDTHKFVFNKLQITDKTHVVCILTNNPFIDSKLISEGYETAKLNDFDTIALDTIEVGGDYLHFRHCYGKDGLLFFHDPEAMKNSGINRQSYVPAFTSISNMRWGKPSFMVDYETYKNEIIQNGSLPIQLPKTRNFDLDDMDDWRIAEAVFKGLFL
jgi:pseudaminic acid cytidylyltransferase